MKTEKDTDTEHGVKKSGWLFCCAALFMTQLETWISVTQFSHLNNEDNTSECLAVE